MNARLGGIIATVVVLHLVGWGGLAVAGLPALGLGLTAYALGLRHAFDADHVAAIDGATRALAEKRPQPQAAGLFFSLGHSSVVFLLVLLLTLGVRSLVGPLGDDDSVLHLVTGTIGPLVSGTFLLLVAVANAIALRRSLKAGSLAGPQGPLYRAFGRLVASARSSRGMYPVGLLFGLGFDTATEIGLLSLAGGAALVTADWYAVLCLPVLFAAGMTALDSADGIVMARIYRWSLDWPERRRVVNVTMTTLTVALAASISLVQFSGLLVDLLGWTRGPLVALARIDMQWLGVWAIGLLVLAWVGARVAWSKRSISGSKGTHNSPMNRAS